MLRILRRIKLGKAAGENSIAFWRFAIAESILIFLGILLALQVDNLNQNRKDRKLERILLSEMRTNLLSDSEDIEYNIRIQQRFLNSSQVVLDFLLSQQPWHDSLGTYFASLMGGSVFDNNNSAYESLNSIGIDLVRNDSLRQQISLVYAARYTKVEKTQEILFTYIFDHLHPALRKNLRTISRMEKTLPVNLDELRQNNGFIEDLRMAIFIYGLSQGTYKRAQEDMIKLVADIELELGLEP